MNQFRFLVVAVSALILASGAEAQDAKEQSSRDALKVRLGELVEARKITFEESINLYLAAFPEDEAAVRKYVEGLKHAKSQDGPLVALLNKIEAQPPPKRYLGSKHQAWVDERMAMLSDEQRGRVGHLWQQKRRLQPKMENDGLSFVKILFYVMNGEKPGRAGGGDGYGQPQSSRAFTQREGRKESRKVAIHGTAVDADGKPLKGVMITVFDEDMEMNTSVFSQTDGSFELTGLRDAEFQVRARLPGKLDEWYDDVKPGRGIVAVKMDPAVGEELQLQRPGTSAFGMLKWKSQRDKENFKMMCMYCHQVGTLGFRTPEKPVDWETMVARMDGFGGLYQHTQKDIVKRLLATYTDDAVSKWPKFVPPAAPTGYASKVKITEWDVGKFMQANVHDLEPGPPGIMYAVDMGQNAIVEVNLKTGSRNVFRMPRGAGGPHSIEPDNAGNYWVTLCGSGHMGKFDPKTKDITLYSSAEAPARRGSYPHTLRVNPKDPKGLIWYTDAGRNSVFSIHPKTGYVKEYHLLEKNQAVAAGKGESRGLTPYGLDFSPVDGMVWYSKLNANRIGRLDPNVPNGNIKEWNPPFRGPRRLHVAQDGIVWVPGFGSGVLGKFDPKTERWITYALPDAENQIPYALNIDPNGYVWICGTGDDTLNRFDPKTERLITIPLPTRVTYTREIEFDEEGNIWTCSSNGPTRHNERGRGSVIKLEIPDDALAEGQGVKLEKVVLSHHQVAYIRQKWHLSKQGELLKQIDAMPAPRGIPVDKTLAQHFPKRLGGMSNQQRELWGLLRQQSDIVDPNPYNRGLTYLKILEYCAERKDLE
ncbi:MAG: carboxypeptidase regulatory-like domain-containing protein [Limisphaerales bacterium]